MAVQKNIFKRTLRAAAVAGARILLRPRVAPLPASTVVKKVLLIKVWALGEYLMATPAFAALRRLYADAEITLLTGVAVAPLAAAASSLFDSVWTAPEEVFVRRRLGASRRLARRVAAERFDVAVVFHHAWEFAVFAAYAGVPHRVGFDRAGDGFAHTVRVPYGERAHQVEEYFDLVRACGAAGEPGPMVVETPPRAGDEVAALAAAYPALADDGFLVVAPGGGVNPKTRMEDKRWPADYYARLIASLAAVGPAFVVGGPGDEEVNRTVAAASGAVDLTGRTSLGTLYLLLRRARAFIGNDSAPMHLAAAAGCPTVAFFGPTNPRLNGPWRTPALVLGTAPSCAPCYADGYFPPCSHRRCLTSYTPDQAAAAVREFLDSVTRG